MALLIGTAQMTSAAPSGNPAHQHELPAWAEQLKGQTIIEDLQEGHVERTAMMERQHQRVMDKINEQMAHDTEVQRGEGYFNNVNMMHQYGAGNQDILLMSSRDLVEHVARFLSWVHVCADREHRQGARGRDEEP
jgi:aminoglycoside N3'-acetyltransferase